jgi:hypothetical protein
MRQARYNSAALGRQGEEEQEQDQGSISISSNAAAVEFTVQYCMTESRFQPANPQSNNRINIIIINNSACDSYPTARIARMACIAGPLSGQRSGAFELVRAWAKSQKCSTSHEHVKDFNPSGESMTGNPQGRQAILDPGASD